VILIKKILDQCGFGGGLASLNVASNVISIVGFRLDFDRQLTEAFAFGPNGVDPRSFPNIFINCFFLEFHILDKLRYYKSVNTFLCYQVIHVVLVTLGFYSAAYLLSRPPSSSLK
jgi:hypothetical protein